MGPLFYMLSDDDRNVVVRRMTAHIGAEYVEQDG